MSFDSNEGAEKALTQGASTSVSVMMPCPWVPGFVQFLKSHPEIDAGLHLTLTSEWDEYRWGPLSGRKTAPGLMDTGGYLWPSVEEAVKHASPDEVETEMTAQLDKARSMGFEPTHLDTHMGTVYGSTEFPDAIYQSGHQKSHSRNAARGSRCSDPGSDAFSRSNACPNPCNWGRLLWNSGTSCLDDLHNTSYEWVIPADIASDDKKLDDFKTAKYIEALKH